MNEGADLNQSMSTHEASILARRAARLARRADAEEDGDELALLTFSVGTERFALPISEVRAVAPMSHYTRVPGTRPELLGVVHLRGELIPLLDLAGLFGVTGSDTSQGQLVLCASGVAPALRVDGVDEVVRILHNALQPPEQAGSRSGLLMGLLPNGTALIRMEALLEHPALGAGARATVGPDKSAEG